VLISIHKVQGYEELVHASDFIDPSGVRTGFLSLISWAFIDGDMYKKKRPQ
jgi:hypothetical protein